MIRILCGVTGVAAALALAAAAGVHVATTQGIDVEAAYPQVWWLHYVSMALFGASMLFAFRLTGPKPHLGEFLAIIPSWALVLIACTLVYTLVCFVTLTPLTGAGVPMISNGRYFFNDHGIVREVSADAFHAERAATVRVFSAVWTYLALIAAVILLFARSTKPQTPHVAAGAK